MKEILQLLMNKADGIRNEIKCNQNEQIGLEKRAYEIQKTITELSAYEYGLNISIRLLQKEIEAAGQ